MDLFANSIDFTGNVSAHTDWARARWSDPGDIDRGIGGR